MSFTNQEIKFEGFPNVQPRRDKVSMGAIHDSWERRRGSHTTPKKTPINIIRLILTQPK
jgi:hypothetical protein